MLLIRNRANKMIGPVRDDLLMNQRRDLRQVLSSSMPRLDAKTVTIPERFSNKKYKRLRPGLH
jgi:hypothetical protein